MIGIIITVLICALLYTKGFTIHIVHTYEPQETPVKEPAPEAQETDTTPVFNADNIVTAINKSLGVFVDDEK